MNAIGRPVSVTCLAILYVALGATGLIYHLPWLHGAESWHREDILIEATEVLALISGIFLLRGRNWARWLAVGWIAFHVVLSVFNGVLETLIHAGICGVIAWILFGPPGGGYFRKTVRA